MKGLVFASYSKKIAEPVRKDGMKLILHLKHHLLKIKSVEFSGPFVVVVFMT